MHLFSEKQRAVVLKALDGGYLNDVNEQVLTSLRTIAEDNPPAKASDDGAIIVECVLYNAYRLQDGERVQYEDWKDGHEIKNATLIDTLSEYV